MKLRTTDGSSVVLVCCPPQFKDKAKPGGCAPPTAPYSFAGPKEQKIPALRWACLARQGGNINSGRTIRSRACTSPAGPEALENLSDCGGLQQQISFLAFPL